MAESMAGDVSPDRLARFMNGETTREFQTLVGHVEQNLAAQTELARTIAKGTTEQLAAALTDLFVEKPELRESPEIKKIIAGAKPHHKHAPLLDVCIDADVPAYLHGEAGSGKSTAAEQVAETRGLAMRAISLVQTTSKTDLLGYMDAGGSYHPTGFREIWENGGIFLFDEIDNGNPNSTAVINRALSGWNNEFPDGSITRSWHTRVVAAANTVGKGATAQFVGRNPIDAATLDRFAMIPWDIDEHLESLILKIEPDAPQEKIQLDEGGVPSREEWVSEVRGFRTRANEKSMRTIISPRASIYGVKLAERGVGYRWLKEMLVYRGMNETDRRKLDGHGR